MSNAINVPVRFFIWAEDAVNENEEYGDIVECNEDAFLGMDFPITYERHTVFENGVSQICLTKMPRF